MGKYHYPIEYRGLRIIRDVLPNETDQYGYVFSDGRRYVAVHDKGQMLTKHGRMNMLARVWLALNNADA